MQATLPRRSRQPGWLCWLAVLGPLLMLLLGARSSPAWAQTRAEPPGVPAEACPAGNLLEGAAFDPKEVRGDLDVLKRADLPQEGSHWDQSAVIIEKTGRLNIDLKQVRPLESLLLQGDNNDRYIVESSKDGQTFEKLWIAEPETEQGLRTRHIKYPSSRLARYLRISAEEGDGFYSVSRLRVYCKTPAAWPPQLLLPPPKTGWEAIDNSVMVDIKGWLAAAGTLLLLWGYVLRKRGQQRKFRKTRDVALAALGAFALVSWWNLLHFHFDGYVHIWEHYHYYIGAKYPELRYARIYDCTAIADIEDGFLSQVKSRKIRNLATTNEIESSERIVQNPALCKSHFSAERWQAFRTDIRFFRGQFTASRWAEAQQDHGYNATPAWAVMGRILATATEASNDGILRLALIDSGILLAMWGGVIWAFGWRAACVALLWWGANYPARFWWNGGAFLRYDWLVTLVGGVCLLKKNKMFAGGAVLTYSTLLRIFPGMVVAAVLLQALLRMARRRGFYLSVSHRQFAAGCCVALAVLIPASGWATQGLDAWVEFAHNSKKHLDTPLTNNMGLKTVIGYNPNPPTQRVRNTPSDDPFSDWKQARREAYSDRKFLHFALLAGFLVVLALATEGRPVWMAAALGTGLIAIAAELTCYYYGFLLTYGLLWHRRYAWRQVPGIAATALAWVTCVLYRTYNNYDVQFTWISVWTTLTVFGVTAYVAYQGHEAAWQPQLAGALDWLGKRLGLAAKPKPKAKRQAEATRSAPDGAPANPVGTGARRQKAR